MCIHRTITFFALGVAMTAVGWRTNIAIEAGRHEKLYIGMDEGASDGFDEGIDKASPPLPPVGFYCFFPLADTAFEFLDMLRGDMRGPSSGALWKIVLYRAEPPIEVVLDDIPRVGLLEINGIEITGEDMAFTFPGLDSVVRLSYSHGLWEKGSSLIEFFMPTPGPAKIAIENRKGDIVRELPEIWLCGGNQRLEWSGKASDGKMLPPGDYTAKITFDMGGVETTISAKTSIEE